MLPPRPLLDGLLSRGLGLWAIIRVSVVAISAMDGAPSLHLDVLAIPVLIATVGMLGYLDARRRGEEVLLSNLGGSPTVFAMTIMVPAALGELAIALFLRL